MTFLDSNKLPNGLYVPYPFKSEIIRQHKRDLSIAIIPYQNAEKLKKIDFSELQLPTNILGTRLTKNSLIELCEWLSECNMYIKKDKWQIFLNSLYDVINYRLFLEDLRKKSVSTQGILINKSAPQFEKNFDSEMVTGTVIIPLLKNCYSLKCRKEIYDKVEPGYITIKNIQIYPVLNQIHPIDVDLENIKRDITYSDLSYLLSNYDQVEKLRSSINLEQYVEIYSEQKKSRYLGFPVLIEGSIQAIDSFIYFKEKESKKNIQYYITSTLLSLISTNEIEKFIGKESYLMGIVWYKYGFYVPQNPECINIFIFDKKIIDASIKIKKGQIIEKYINDYNKRCDSIIELEDLLDIDLLTELKLTNIFKKKISKFNNYLELLNLTEKEKSLRNTYFKISFKRDLDFFLYYDLITIDKNLVIKSTEKGINLFTNLLIDMYKKYFEEFLKNMSLFNIKLFYNYFNSNYNIPYIILEKIIIWMIDNKKLIKIDNNGLFLKSYLNIDYYYTEYYTSSINPKDYLAKHYDIILQLIKTIMIRYNHGMGLEAIQERVENESDDDIIKSDIDDSVKNGCDYLESTHIFIKKYPGYFYPYESRIKEIFTNSERNFYTEEEIKKLCNLPYFNSEFDLKKMTYLKIIGTDIYYLSANLNINDPKLDYIKEYSIYEFIKELKKGPLNRSLSIDTIHKYSKSSGKEVGINMDRRTCLGWYLELLDKKRIKEHDNQTFIS